MANLIADYAKVYIILGLSTHGNYYSLHVHGFLLLSS